MDDLNPIVTRRDDGTYVLHNVDLVPLTTPERAGIGLLVWQQVRKLMEQNGEDAHTLRLVGERVAEIVRVPRTQMVRSGSAMNRKGADHLDDLIAGNLTLQGFWRKAGLREPLTMDTKPVVAAKDGTIYYGKGDRFNDVAEPILRYLKAWKNKGFEFRHVAPKEARRRVAKINSMIADLEEAKRDLEGRSHFATLSTPSEKRRR